MKEIQYPSYSYDTEQGNEGNYLNAHMLQADRERREGRLSEEDYQRVREAIFRQSEFIKTTGKPEPVGVEIDGIIFFAGEYSLEQKKLIAQMLTNKYLRNASYKLVDLLTQSRLLQVEDLMDWEEIKKPKHLIEG